MKARAPGEPVSAGGHSKNELGPSLTPEVVVSAPEPVRSAPFQRLVENEDQRQQDRALLHRSMLFRVSSQVDERQRHLQATTTKGARYPMIPIIS